MTKNKVLLYLFILAIALSFNLLGRSSVFAQSSNQIWGLDISHHQGSINWTTLAAKKPDFIFLKATEGSTHTDPTYAASKAAARKRGITTGAYHFFSYTSPGLRQALHFIKTAKLGRGDLPPVLDIEWKKPMPSVSAVIREVTGFLNTVERQIGVRPIIYTDCMLFNQYLKAGLTKQYKLWIASYQSKPGCDCLFWQKTNGFKISGIGGYVDYNLFMGTRTQFRSIIMD